MLLLGHPHAQSSPQTGAGGGAGVGAGPLLVLAKTRLLALVISSADFGIGVRVGAVPALAGRGTVQQRSMA